MTSSFIVRMGCKAALLTILICY